MKKVYLFVYSENAGKLDDMKALLSRMSEITHWRFDLPYSFYLVSESSAKELAIKIRESLGDKGRFILTEIKTNYWGWLTNESWYLIKNKEYKPKEAGE